MSKTKLLRDFVFPLIKGKQKKDSIQAGELIGTGFLIGKDGYAITAAHVIDQLLEGNVEDDVILGLFVDNDQWVAVYIESYEKHDTEDVGILKFKTFKRKSFLKINDTPQHSACEYNCWGYPHEVAKELSKLYENSPERPDLIFTQGYVRRRISRELYPTMIFRGKQFYELSETVGGGNSGGPLILKNSVGKKHWEIIGIYIGEKSEGDISYGVRAEAFANWVPKILGKSVIEESNNVA
jgi:hypothetical protein